jgi:hypothetical protein
LVGQDFLALLLFPVTPGASDHHWIDSGIASSGRIGRAREPLICGGGRSLLARVQRIWVLREPVSILPTTRLTSALTILL